VAIEQDGERVTKVEDRWDGEVPLDGVFAKVSDAFSYICLEVPFA
jgi:hypothetical protein